MYKRISLHHDLGKFFLKLCRFFKNISMMLQNFKHDDGTTKVYCNMLSTDNKIHSIHRYLQRYIK